jgi:hypothetical protein
VPILYEGRTADGMVKDADNLDQLFEDMFKEYTPEELAVIKAKYATESDVLAAPLLIEKKARDMIRHFVSVVLPSGFKAQVVATSREAAITYQEKLSQARDALVAEIESLPADYPPASTNEIGTPFLFPQPKTISSRRRSKSVVIPANPPPGSFSWQSTPAL